jgi:hypothetical protein
VSEGRWDELYVPEELEPGVYANAISVWHSAHEFTFDFMAAERPRLRDPEDPDSQVIRPMRVVARIRVPTTLMLDVLKAGSTEMALYEKQYGEILQRKEDVQ